MNHFRGETCKKGTETGEEGACVPRFWQFGEQQFGFRVVFIGPQVFKTKDANDSEGLGYGLLVPAGLWSMCWSLCPHESVTPNACSWRSLRETNNFSLFTFYVLGYAFIYGQKSKDIINICFTRSRIHINGVF